MANISLIEWLGYGASVLVLISLSMSSISRLRWFNLAGALAFAVYGALIGAWPVAVVNIAIAAVNVYFLAQFYTRKDYFKTLVIGADDDYLREFLTYYLDDIRKWYPEFSGELADNSFVVLSLRNLAIAGVFAAVETNKGSLGIVIEYVIPEYADRKVGRHLYRDSQVLFRDNGFSRLTIETAPIENEGYFRAMGFRNSGVYGKELLVLDMSKAG